MSLNNAQRERLGQLARIMVPGGHGMPSADEVDLVQAPVDEVLEIDPIRKSGLLRFLALEGNCESLTDVESLAQTDPTGFSDLGVVLANAYFMHADVRATIGYPGQEARDSSGGLTDEDLALLNDVIDRGPIYREA